MAFPFPSFAYNGVAFNSIAKKQTSTICKNMVKDPEVQYLHNIATGKNSINSHSALKSCSQIGTLDGDSNSLVMGFFIDGYKQLVSVYNVTSKSFSGALVYEKSPQKRSGDLILTFTTTDRELKIAVHPNKQSRSDNNTQLEMLEYRTIPSKEKTSVAQTIGYNRSNYEGAFHASSRGCGITCAVVGVLVCAPTTGLGAVIGCGLAAIFVCDWICSPPPVR